MSDSIPEPKEALLFDNFLNIRPAKEEDLTPLKQAANADGGQVISPSQVIERKGEYLGYIALATIATNFVWLDKKKLSMRDYLHVLQFVQNMSAAMQAEYMCFPVEPSSGLHPWMTRAGFEKAYNADLFIKPLK